MRIRCSQTQGTNEQRVGVARRQTITVTNYTPTGAMTDTPRTSLDARAAICKPAVLQVAVEFTGRRRLPTSCPAACVPHYSTSLHVVSASHATTTSAAAGGGGPAVSSRVAPLARAAPRLGRPARVGAGRTDAEPAAGGADQWRRNALGAESVISNRGLRASHGGARPPAGVWALFGRRNAAPRMMMRCESRAAANADACREQGPVRCELRYCY
jgi:hypothetical protein